MTAAVCNDATCLAACSTSTDKLHERVCAPFTVSRWAKEGKLPFMSTLGGHRRYPEAEIRKLVDELRQEPTA
jgi:predicted site-specific integrase-resolvase